MINKIYALMLMSFIAVGCSEPDMPCDRPIGDNEIAFTANDLTADWGTKAATRGIAVDDVNTMSEILVYSFLTNTTAQTPGAYINNEAAEMNSSKIWSFTPPEYYPYDETLDFLAYVPAADATTNGLTQTMDLASKSVKFTYETPLVGRNQPDLMMATPATACSKDNELGTLDFKHALTQLTMSAKVKQAKDKNRYVITRFTLQNIVTKAEMTYSVDGGIGEWGSPEYHNFIVSAMLPQTELGEMPVLLKAAKYQSIMSNGQALFMIPQLLGTSSIGIAPTIQITIADTKSDAIYRTDKITLPAPTGTTGWVAGQHVDLQFEFDVDNEDVVIPMSLIAKLVDWIEQPVDKEIDANIYAFLSEEVVAAGGETITLFTNGEVTEVTGVATLGAKVENGYELTVTGGGDITVKIKNSHDKIITKTFNITEE